jgi:abortive infection bacteriophage resistance protein
LSGAQETLEALGHFLYYTEVKLKEYKNNEELIDYLIDKNVIINDKKQALQNIEKYSYYSIVNGYKAVFKNENNNYKENTSFEEIFALYEFDKNIKAIFLKYTLEIEVIIKSLMANIIAEEYGIEEYLKAESFDDNTDENLINDFIEKIEKKINDNYIKHPAIKHYKDTYNFVPPFVLTKILTFGAISRYYSLLKQSDRQKISKYFKISDKLLRQILINLTMVRNISAHSDRLFNYRNKYDISFKNIEKDYNRKEYLCNLYMIIKSMKVLLDEEKYKEFENLLNVEIEKLKNKLIVIDINDILRIMGYEV